MTKEMKILFPAETVKLSTGEVVSISPVPFGKLKYFSDAAAKLINAIQSKGLDLETVDYQTLFDVAFDEIITIMGLVLNKDRAWFDKIMIEDGIEIISVIIKQNFNDSVKKNMAKLIMEITSLLRTQSKS